MVAKDRCASLETFQKHSIPQPVPRWGRFVLENICVIDLRLPSKQVADTLKVHIF